MCAMEEFTDDEPRLSCNVGVAITSMTVSQRRGGVTTSLSRRCLGECASIPGRGYEIKPGQTLSKKYDGAKRITISQIIQTCATNEMAEATKIHGRLVKSKRSHCVAIQKTTRP